MRDIYILLCKQQDSGVHNPQAILRIQPEIKIKDLSYLLGIRQQSLRELLNKLEKSTYIKRKTSEEESQL